MTTRDQRFHHLDDSERHDPPSPVDPRGGACDEAVSAPRVLDAAEAAFRLLTTGPAPLAVDGSVLGHGLPRRLLPLDEVRELLLNAGTGHEAREAIWQVLVRNARERGAAWVVGAVGVAIPGLRNVAGELARGYTGDVEDLDAEVVAGFTERLKTIDPDAGSLAARLVWAAQRAGARLRAAEWEHAARRLPLLDSIEPPAPWGHPDLVLADAVTEGIITEFEASMIIATRLENTHLTTLARTLEFSYEQLRYLRDLAEYRLVRYLTEQRRKRIFNKISQTAA